MTDSADTDRRPLGQLSKPPKPPRLSGFNQPTIPKPEPAPKPKPKTKAKAQPKPKTKTKAKTKAKAQPKPKTKTKAARSEPEPVPAAPRTEPAPAVPSGIVRTATRLPQTLASRVRAEAQHRGISRARLLLIAYLDHAPNLQQLLHPEPVTPLERRYASVGLRPELPDTEPTVMVTWELPAAGMQRLDEAGQQHDVTRSALIRAVLAAACPEQPPTSS